MAPASLKLASDHTVADDTPLIDRPSGTSETARRIERLPTEVGVLLLSAGITMSLTPPPPGPFDLSIMLSGGLILWPRGFRAIDGWARRRPLRSERHTGPACSLSDRHPPGRHLGFRAARGDGPGGCGRRALDRRGGPGDRRRIPDGIRRAVRPRDRTLGILVLARWLYPSPRDLEPATPIYHGRGFPLAFWLYLAAAALVAAGYADFPLIAYHFGKTSVVPAGWIPVFYAAAMGVDALAAPRSGDASTGSGWRP